MTTWSLRGFVMNVFEKLPIEKKDKIIQLSMEEFAEHGYELASTNRIVRSLGISKGSLFKYFSTKASLYMYLVECATKDLMHYLDDNLYLKDKIKWQEYLLHYASVEFDYLVKEPVKYRFFKNFVKEINHKALSSIKENLLALSQNYLLSIKKDLKVNEDLFQHLVFIIKGYNEFFLEDMCKYEVTEDTKRKYLDGLKKQFEYVKE